jgi:hypothetical protein
MIGSMIFCGIFAVQFRACVHFLLHQLVNRFFPLDNIAHSGFSRLALAIAVGT